MHTFLNRPLALSSVAAIVCAVLLWDSGSKTKLILLAAIFVGVLALFLFCILRKRFGAGCVQALLILLLTGAAVLSSYLYFNIRYEKYQSYIGAELAASGYVLERDASYPYLTTHSVMITELNGEACRVKARLACDYLTALQIGDGFSMSVTPTEPFEDETVSQRKTLLSEGFLMYLSATESNACDIRVGEADMHPQIVLSRLNTRLSYTLRECIGGEAGGIAAALLLGNRSFIDDSTALAFRRSGTTHLLAISGLHVSILIGFAELLFKKLRVRRILQGICIPMLALAYLALTGCSLSTVRAVVMLLAVYIAWAFGDDNDPFTALSITLLLILNISPNAVLDPSLWMSFLATGSIILFSEPITAIADSFCGICRLSRRPAQIIGSFLTAIGVGMIANLALLLYTAFLFGEISMASVPATLLMSVSVTLLLAFSAILLLLPFLPLLPELCAAIGNFMLKATAFFSDIEHVMLPAKNTVTLICFGVLTAILIFLAVAKLKSRLWAIPIPLVFVITLVLTAAVVRNTNSAVPIALEAGWGEIRIYTSQGTNVVVNDARRNSSEAYEIKMASLSAHCTEVGDLVFTGFYNQGNYFINKLASGIKVRRIHFPEPGNENERAIAMRLEQEARLHGMTVEYDAEDWLIRLKDASLSHASFDIS